jgi:quinol monooxygenase YgiN
MSELFIVVGLRAKAGKEDELRRDLPVLVEPSRKEDGNTRHDLFEDQDQPGLFVFVEEWSSVETRTRHHEHGPIICTVANRFHAISHSLSMGSK